MPIALPDSAVNIVINYKYERRGSLYLFAYPTSGLSHCHCHRISNSISPRRDILYIIPTYIINVSRVQYTQRRRCGCVSLVTMLNLRDSDAKD